MKVGFYFGGLVSHQYRGIGVYSNNLLNNLEDQGIEIIEINDLNSQVDIIHYPFFDLFSNTLKIGQIPTVVTIHDVTPLIFPKEYPPGLRGMRNFKKQKELLKKVRAVITDSNASKKDIVKYLEVEESKIFPIHLGYSKKYRKISNPKNISQKYHLPEKFVLHVGDINYNKNIINKIKACQIANIPLVIVGKQASEIEALIKSRNINGPRDLARLIIGKSHPELTHLKSFLKLSDHTIRLGYVGDEDIVAIYNLAYCLLATSLYEGFCLPVLEAQACGTPVITSNISSMPEVAGEGAILTDPTDIKGMAKAINDLKQPKLRNQLIEKGFENIKQFSWEKTAKETITVYEKAFNQT